MLFDPTFPHEDTLADAAQMRSQLNGLKTLLDAVPAGPQGPPFAQAIVDAVNTLEPGNAANVSVSFDGTNVHFTFDLPRGNDGGVGQPGSNGSDGAPGGDGSDGAPGSNGGDGSSGQQGPPFADAVVDGVNTLNPGENASVSVSFDGSNVHFTFGIPRGDDGAPGEVTGAQLASALSGTSNNTNAVSTLDAPFTNDPPTLADMELTRAKYNELVLALRR